MFLNSMNPVGATCGRLWRIKEASVGAAVDFVRRSKPHKIGTPQEGNRWHAAGVTKGENAINIKFAFSLPQSFFIRKMTAPFTRELMSDSRKGCFYGVV